jgi:tRNA threonylcarbamoyl adenosine modification protein (Sua5/YciO/YrdC/YwlC family)
MLAAAVDSLLCVMEGVSDPRAQRGVRYRFSSLLSLVFLGLVSRHTEFAAIRRWALLHWDVLREPLGFPDQPPPHATMLSRAMALFSLDEFQAPFANWLRTLAKDVSVAAVDGKVCRNGHGTTGDPVTMLNVFAQDVKACLAQWPLTGDKLTEPEVLKAHLAELFDVPIPHSTFSRAGINDFAIVLYPPAKHLDFSANGDKFNVCAAARAKHRSPIGLSAVEIPTHLPKLRLLMAAPRVIDIRSAEDSRDVVHQAVQALAEGKLVALPTETVYGLAATALDERAVERLTAVKQRPVGQPLTLAVKSADDALDYVPNLSPLGRRLTRRCWPGPVTIVVADHHPESLMHQLCPGVQQAVAPAGTIGLRVPAHQAVLDILRMMAGPLALTSANRSGQPEALTAEDVLKTFGDQVQLVLNDGRSRLGQASTVVKVGESGLQVMRPGVVSEQTLKRLSSLIVLLVCTGNTCRSPMAEALCRKMIADRKGCAPAELSERGIVVMSAGISAMAGSRPSPEAVDVIARSGLNLADHESQPLTAQLVRHADIIWTMTRSHRQAIVAQWPDAAPRTQVLCRDEGDIADPIGGPVEFYERCAAQIKAELAARIIELEF